MRRNSVQRVKARRAVAAGILERNIKSLNQQLSGGVWPSGIVFTPEDRKILQSRIERSTGELAVVEQRLKSSAPHRYYINRASQKVKTDDILTTT